MGCCSSNATNPLSKNKIKSHKPKTIDPEKISNIKEEESVELKALESHKVENSVSESDREDEKEIEEGEIKNEIIVENDGVVLSDKKEEKGEDMEDFEEIGDESEEEKKQESMGKISKTEEIKENIEKDSQTEESKEGIEKDRKTEEIKQNVSKAGEIKENMVVRKSKKNIFVISSRNKNKHKMAETAKVEEKIKSEISPINIKFDSEAISPQNRKEKFCSKLPKIDDKFMLKSEFSKKKITLNKNKKLKKKVTLDVPDINNVHSVTTKDTRKKKKDFTIEEIEEKFDEILTAKSEKIDFIYHKFGSKRAFEEYIEKRKESIKKNSTNQNPVGSQNEKSN